MISQIGGSKICGPYHPPHHSSSEFNNIPLKFKFSGVQHGIRLNHIDHNGTPVNKTKANSIYSGTNHEWVESTSKPLGSTKNDR